MGLKFLKSKCCKKCCDNNGSTLILLVIIISVVITLGTSLMSISIMHYKIKKSNTEIKKSFYMSETGINESFSNAYDLIVEAVGDSIEKAEEYLVIYPLNTSEAANIFDNNFKTFVVGEIEDRINKNSNPKIEIVNSEVLLFINNSITVSIKSKYISNSGVESTTIADLTILVPDYNLIDFIDLSMLISVDNWIIRR